MEINQNELEPVENPNLVFKQDGKADLLNTIKDFGFTGPEEAA